MARDNEATSDPVKSLADSLIKDFDKRYEPANDEGKVSYDKALPRGDRKRYKTLHPYVFYSAFLNPRTKANLKKNIMTRDHHKELLKDIKSLMIEREERDRIDQDEEEQSNNSQNDGTSSPSMKRMRKDDHTSIFSNLMAVPNNHDDSSDNDDDVLVEINIETRCDVKLAQFMKKKHVHWPFLNEKGEVNNPLCIGGKQMVHQNFLFWQSWHINSYLFLPH